jgi:hypothetical protein
MRRKQRKGKPNSSYEEETEKGQPNACPSACICGVSVVFPATLATQALYDPL